MALRRSNSVRTATRAVARALPVPTRLGEIVEMGPGRTVLVAGEDGEQCQARCARSIDVAWLTAALAQVGPVPVGLIDARGGWWVACVLDGPEFDLVQADLELRGRNISLATTGEVRVDGARVTLACQRSRVQVSEQTVEIRAADVTSRARRTNRVKGGVVRIN